MSLHLPAGVACQVHYRCMSGVLHVVDIPEPRCPFAVLEAVEKRLGLAPKERDEKYDAMMASRWELEPLPKRGKKAE